MRTRTSWTTSSARRRIVFNLTRGGGEARLVSAGYLSGTAFDVLGVRPVVGRTLTPLDDSNGAPPVAVISHGLWQREYAGAHDVVGRTIHLDDIRATGADRHA